MIRKTVLTVIAAAFLAAPAFARLQAGEEAPDFKLFGVDYRYHELSEYLAREDTLAVVVIFTCNHCPVAVRYEDPLLELADKYMGKGFPFIAVNPNPADMVAADGFPQMIIRAQEKKLPYPYVYDETQKTARAYGAAVTPEIFVVGKDGNVLYAGAVDNRGREPRYLSDALDDILAGENIRNPQSAPFGCTVKYR